MLFNNLAFFAQFVIF